MNIGLSVILPVSLCLLVLLVFISLVSAVPAWFEDAVFYEIFVRSFADGDGDGVGDLQGLTAHLDRLNDGDAGNDGDLGISALWLMPVFPAISDHGYDVTDYRRIHRDYGTLEQFRELVSNCHRRGIRVILDLVINHTSSAHPWFIRSAWGPGARHRGWYIWRRTRPSGWKRPWDNTGFDPVWHARQGAYYYGLFWSGMPDLNFRNRSVRREIKQIVRFWLEQGVDGFRLDAVRYYVEDGAGSGQFDTKKNHSWCRELASEVRSAQAEAVTVAEAWAPMEVATGYMEAGEFDSVFNFDFAQAVIRSLRDRDPRPLQAVLEVRERILRTGMRDSIFLSNHDQDRIASHLQHDPARLKLAAGLLLTLPGTPFLYYGEEIGMTGVKPDQNIRTPLCWESTDGLNRNHCPLGSVREQIGRTGSLWRHYRDIIQLRSRSVALRRGDLRLLHSSNPGLLSYMRSAEGEMVLIVQNFSDRTRAQVDLTVPEDLPAPPVWKTIFPPLALGRASLTGKDILTLHELPPDSMTIWLASSLPGETSR